MGDFTAGNGTPVVVDRSSGSAYVLTDEGGIADIKNAVISVKDMAGVVGDGSHDDYSGIQRAMDRVPENAWGGYFVYFPPGRYKISQSLVITSRWMSLVGGGGMIGPAGTTILTTDPNIDMIVGTTGLIDSFSMKDLVLYHAMKGGASVGRALVLGVAGSSSRTCFSAELSNCWITSVPGIGVDLQNTADFRIHGGTMENCGTATVNVAGSTYSGNQTQFSSTDVTYFGSTIAVSIVGGSTAASLVGNRFWFCGTTPGGAVDLVSGGVVIDHSGADGVRGVNVVGNKFIGNVNDVLIFGHNGNNASNTGVNDTSVMGNHSYGAYGRFLYNDGANDTVVVGNKIERPSQGGDNTYDVITNTGQSDGFSVSSNFSSKILGGISPRYGLNIGGTTTNNVIGPNHFEATTANIFIDPSSTQKSGYEGGLMVELAQKYSIIARQDATHRMMLGAIGGVGYVGSLDNMLVSLQVNNNQIGYLSPTGLDGCDIGQTTAAKGKFSEIKYGASSAIGALTVTNYMDWKLADGTAVKVALVS